MEAGHLQWLADWLIWRTPTGYCHLAVGLDHIVIMKSFSDLLGLVEDQVNMCHSVCLC